MSKLLATTLVTHFDELFIYVILDVSSNVKIQTETPSFIQGNDEFHFVSCH